METSSRFQVRLNRPGLQTIEFTGSFSLYAKSGPAVIVLAQWNARWEEQQSVCRWLNRLGITAIKMSLPYHDRRAIPGHPRADYLVGSNIGLTLQANRQAVLDARRTGRWLEQQGYGPLGVLGTSIGSCIGFNTMCHEPALRAGAFLHVSTYFGEVVANGLTTCQCVGVAAAGNHRGGSDALLVAHQPISIHRKIARRGKKMLAITARYDPTFWPEFTNQFLRCGGSKISRLRPCLCGVATIRWGWRRLNTLRATVLGVSTKGVNLRGTCRKSELVLVAVSNRRLCLNFVCRSRRRFSLRWGELFDWPELLAPPKFRSRFK